VLNGVLHAGATLVVMPRFDLEAFLEAIQRYRVTGMHVVPPIVLALAKHPAVDRYDLSSLRWVNSGAAPLDAALTHAAAGRLRCAVRQGYGLTETSPVTHFLREDEAVAHAGTVGRPLPGTEVRIVDVESGRDVPAGATGEIWLRGPQVMLGYLGKPEATAAMLTPDGWLRTGDVGVQDAEGFLRVVDRVKELIKFKGMQVAPAELEALLLTHPSVGDVAVIPHPDAEAGEIPAAYVVPRAGVAADAALAQELMTFLAGRVAPHKRVREVHFLEQVPKSASGKILRRVLVEQARARRAAAPA
jgi:acyl-CoA synthetase (AMP-forming)/AMP-acid ligase II